jgi:imidazoleglycerol-phosphate dehydratase
VVAWRYRVKKKLTRRSKETTVEVIIESLEAAGLGKAAVSTTLPFFDHMLSTFLRYGGVSGSVVASGDLTHHVMEDVAITVGRAIRSALPAALARFGERTVPMDDALVHAAIDVGGRFYFEGELPNRLHTHVMRSLAESLGATLHLTVLRGRDRHHVIEAGYKAFGLALREALRTTGGDVFSSKGSVVYLEEELP